MKNTFEGMWGRIGELDIDQTSNLIVTGKKASAVVPDEWIYKFIGKPEDTITVLDFGCGFGRNSFGMANHGKRWSVIGYDSEGMLAKTKEFAAVNYGGKIPTNLQFVSEWEHLRCQTFDRIVCIIVLQHINEAPLVQYLTDFKQMTKRLIVSGRRYNDDEKRRSTWTILQEQGLTPTGFYINDVTQVQYAPEGDPEQHHLACYTIA